MLKGGVSPTRSEVDINFGYVVGHYDNRHFR